MNTASRLRATEASRNNASAFSAFTFVNLCVIAMFIRQRRKHGPSQRVVPHVVFPAIGAVVDVYLLLHLDGKAKLLGLGWLTLGVLYLAYLTRGFRRPPPEIDLVEERAGLSPVSPSNLSHVGRLRPGRRLVTKNGWRQDRHRDQAACLVVPAICPTCAQELLSPSDRATSPRASPTIGVICRSSAKASLLPCRPSASRQSRASAANSWVDNPASSSFWSRVIGARVALPFSSRPAS